MTTLMLILTSITLYEVLTSLLTFLLIKNSRTLRYAIRDFLDRIDKVRDYADIEEDDFDDEEWYGMEEEVVKSEDVC